MSEYAEWLLGIAKRIGLNRGDSSTGFGDVRNWCELSGIALTLWECESVVAISSAFVRSIHAHGKKDGDDSNSLPPWLPEGMAERVSERRAAFAKFTGKGD